MVKEEAKNANAHAPAETACATRGETSMGRVSVGETIGELARKAVECLEESEERRWDRNNNAGWAECEAAEEASKRSMADLSAAVYEVSAEVFGGADLIDGRSVEAACMGLVEDQRRHNIENVTEADAAWAYQIEAGGTVELSYDEVCERLRNTGLTTHAKGAAAIDERAITSTAAFASSVADEDKMTWYPDRWTPEGYYEMCDEGVGIQGFVQEYGQDFVSHDLGLPNFLGDALVAAAELGGAR